MRIGVVNLFRSKAAALLRERRLQAMLARL